MYLNTYKMCATISKDKLIFWTRSRSSLHLLTNLQQQIVWYMQTELWLIYIELYKGIFGPNIPIIDHAWPQKVINDKYNFWAQIHNKLRRHCKITDFTHNAKSIQASEQISNGFCKLKDKFFAKIIRDRKALNCKCSWITLERKFSLLFESLLRPFSASTNLDLTMYTDSEAQKPIWHFAIKWIDNLYCTGNCIVDASFWESSTTSLAKLATKLAYNCQLKFTQPIRLFSQSQFDWFLHQIS